MKPIKEHVFLCTISESLSNEERTFLSSNFLSKAEHEKLLLLKDEKKRDEYLQSHAFVRFILSNILEVAPSSISFYTNAFGKPFISEKINTRQLFFNLSHTLGLAALITGDEGLIGIDVEKVIIRDDISSLEQIVLHDEELIEAKKITDEIERTRNFYMKWVIKESFLKAIGTGLSLDPKLLLIVNDAKDRFKVISAMIGNADSFDTTYKAFSNFAIAYTTSNNQNTDINPNTGVYNYSNCVFDLVTD